MKINILIAFIVCSLLTGCEAVHQTTKAGGEVIGQGAKSLGGITEGGAEAMKGKESPEDNPYGR